MPTIPEYLRQIRENVPKVYSAGGNAWLTKFWNDYQKRGARTDYSNAFSGKGWDVSCFRPMYNIHPTASAENMFAHSSMPINLKDHLSYRIAGNTSTSDMKCLSGAAIQGLSIKKIVADSGDNAYVVYFPCVASATYTIYIEKDTTQAYTYLCSVAVLKTKPAIDVTYDRLYTPVIGSSSPNVCKLTTDNTDQYIAIQIVQESSDTGTAPMPTSAEDAISFILSSYLTDSSENSLTISTHHATNICGLYKDTDFTQVPTVTISGTLTSSVWGLFTDSDNLVSVDIEVKKEFLSSSYKVLWDQCFERCLALTSLSFNTTADDGKCITNSIDLHWSKNLNKTSIESVIDHLSTSVSDSPVCTLSLEAVNAAFETATGANDGSTSSTWTSKISAIPNWTFALI